MNKRVYILAILLLIGLSLSAQLNVKVGFAFDRLSDDHISAIIDQYNADHPELDQLMSNMEYRAGLDVGIRYRISQSSIEVFGTLIRAKSESLGDVSSNFSEELKSTMRMYGVSLAYRIGSIDIGSTLGYNRLEYKLKADGSNTEESIMKERSPFTRVFINFEFTSEQIAFSIRPYYQWSLADYDITGLRDRLAPSTALSGENLMISPTSWGVTIALYNGPQ